MHGSRIIISTEKKQEKSSEGCFRMQGLIVITVLLIFAFGGSLKSSISSQV